MTFINHRVLSVASVLLLTGGVASAQAVSTSQPGSEQKSTYRPWYWNTTVQEKPDPALVTAMKNYTPPPYTLPWPLLPERDIQVKTRIWRDIDLSEKENSAFTAEENKQKSSLINVLMQGVFQGKIKAYDAVHDSRFLKVLSKEDLIALIAPGSGGKGYNPAGVVKYQVKEDWLLLKENNAMQVRIVGLAPVIAIKGADGAVIEQPLFWLFYPDCRTYLAQHTVPAGKYAGINWDQLFEARNFSSSKILKTSVSTPSFSPQGK